MGWNGAWAGKVQQDKGLEVMREYYAGLVEQEKTQVNAAGQRQCLSEGE